MTKQSFTAGTVEAPSFYAMSLANEAPIVAQGRIVRGVKVFRAGTFKDSKGRAKTWTAAELADMVKHFNQLRASGIFPNVPIRLDHTESVKDIVGYYAGLYLDPSDPNYVLADLEFTEPDALEKWNRGTLRSRSIEINRYEDNDGNKYYPTVMGLAFVDFPALEQLYRLSTEGGTGTGEPPAPAPADPNKEKKMAKFKLNGTQETEDEAAVQAHIATLEAFRASAETQLSHKFRINGQETSDFAAVQNHCLALETFRTETIKGGRHEYVKQLAKDGKIGNAMIETFSTMVETMDEAHFTSWKAAYDAAPKLDLFGKHVGGEGGNGNDGKKTPEQDQIEIAEEIVRSFRLSNQSEEFIKNTDAYKFLDAHKAKS